MRHVSAFASIFALTASSAIGGTQSQTQRHDAASGVKPEKLICEKVEEIGTRLGASKECLTATQWARRRSGDRDYAERIQAGTQHSLPDSPNGH